MRTVRCSGRVGGGGGECLPSGVSARWGSAEEGVCLGGACPGGCLPGGGMSVS